MMVFGGFGGILEALGGIGKFLRVFGGFWSFLKGSCGVACVSSLWWYGCGIFIGGVSVVVLMGE